jgi:hypothetical protein
MHDISNKYVFYLPTKQNIAYTYMIRFPRATGHTTGKGSHAPYLPIQTGCSGGKREFVPVMLACFAVPSVAPAETGVEIGESFGSSPQKLAPFEDEFETIDTTARPLLDDRRCAEEGVAGFLTCRSSDR